MTCKFESSIVALCLFTTEYTIQEDILSEVSKAESDAGAYLDQFSRLGGQGYCVSGVRIVPSILGCY